jgi:predicted MFS family arabinose efflux permease
VTSDSEVSHWFSFATPFYIAAFLSVIALVWLQFGFTETYQATVRKPIQLTRPIKIFIEAFEHQKVRTLAIVFLLMQMGFSLYFQYIIVQMEQEYSYSNALLGGVQGMIGIGFAVGLLIGIPLALKFWQILAIAIATGLLTGLGQIIAAIVTVASFQWVLAFLIASVNIMVFTGMLTLFSDSVDKQSQGWAMGIANAVLACAWAITGLMSNLLDILSTRGLIFFGGICLIVASLWLYKKRSHYINKDGSKNITPNHFL